MISHLLLDADGVLQDREDERVLLARIGDLLDLDEAGVGDFLEVALAAERPCLEGRDRWARVLPELLERWEARERAEELLTLWCDTEVVAPALALAMRVREQGVRCWIASNQDVLRASVMEERFSYASLLDGSFYSHAVGVAKPDPAYFEQILVRLGAAPGAVAFVDDREDNVEAARGLGIRAVRWQRREGTSVLGAHLRALGVPV